MLGNLIATAATTNTTAGALLITSRRGRPLGGHLYVQVAAVVGPQHGRRRRRVGRGRATVGGVNHRHDQRLADVQSRRGQIVNGAVFAQHVDLFRGPARHGVGHAEIVRFVGTSGPRVVQVVVLSVEIFVAIFVLDFIVNVILIIDCIVVWICHIRIKVLLTLREVLDGIRSVRSNRLVLRIAILVQVGLLCS